MDVFELTRALVDIESVTGNEKRVGLFLMDSLQKLATTYSGEVERIEVAPGRFNVLARWGKPIVTFSTHMDTVPPFFPSRENDEFIFGRGACDAKGILAAMMAAAEKMLAEGARNFALLFLAGEERNSAGAYVAARRPHGSRYLINGEPTGNRLAIGSKGALRCEIVTRGKMAHSAYPELGHSAIETLLDVLDAVRRIPFPSDATLGGTTLNIGTIAGGRAPNVIADEARAEIMIRLTGDVEPVRSAIAKAVAGRAVINEIICTPVSRFGRLDGIPTTVVSYTTDAPILAKTWGKPFLLGPGSIQAAHTPEEHIPKRQLLEAVEIYAKIARELLTEDPERA